MLIMLNNYRDIELYCIKNSKSNKNATVLFKNKI